MPESDTDHRTLRVSLVGALVLTAVSLVLGYVGYRTLGLTPADAFFGTLQMFALDAPRELASNSFAIGVARFTAPLALVMASVVAGGVGSGVAGSFMPTPRQVPTGVAPVSTSSTSWLRTV